MDACPRCLFGSSNCLCVDLPLCKFRSDLRVVIIQDIGECKPSKRAVSSVPVLLQVLDYVEVVCCSSGNFRVDLDLSVYNESTEVALLYPSEMSVPITDLVDRSDRASSESGASLSHLKVLLVLDGSWVTVQHILARNSFLRPNRCRHVRLPRCRSIPASVFHTSGLRKEPARSFISTAEAVAWAIFFLRDELKPAALEILKLFEKFVRLKVSVDRSSHCEISEKTVLYVQNDDLVDEEQAPMTFCADDSGDLLPSNGAKQRHPISKSEKRKRMRQKEKRRNR
jgi:DTW domain-containing protein YfiP